MVLKRHITLAVLRGLLAFGLIYVMAFSHSKWGEAYPGDGQQGFGFIIIFIVIGIAAASLFFVLGSLAQFLFQRRPIRYTVLADVLMFLMFVGVLVYAGATAHYSDTQGGGLPLSTQIQSAGGTHALIRDCETILAEFQKVQKESWIAGESELPTTIAALQPQIVQATHYDNFPIVDIQITGGFQHHGLMIILTNTPPDFLPRKSSWKVTKIANNIYEYRE